MESKTISVLIILISLFLLASCLTIESELSLNDDESGTVRLEYSVSTLAVDIAKIDKDNSVLPFPIMEDEFDAAILKGNGVQKLEYEMSDDGARYYIRSLISFDSLNSLSLFTGSQFLLENQGSNKLLTVTVYDFPEDYEIDIQTLNIVSENFAEDFISFTVTIPGDIVRVNGATFSGSEVSFTITVEDLIQSTENVQFSVEYR